MKSKLLSPHLILVVVSIIYLIIGAWVFQKLEGGPMQEAKDRQLKQIRIDSEQYVAQVWDIIQENRDSIHSMDRKELIKMINQESSTKFGKVSYILLYI